MSLGIDFRGGIMEGRWTDGLLDGWMKEGISVELQCQTEIVYRRIQLLPTKLGRSRRKYCSKEQNLLDSSPL